MYGNEQKIFLGFLTSNYPSITSRFKHRGRYVCMNLYHAAHFCTVIVPTAFLSLVSSNKRCRNSPKGIPWFLAPFRNPISTLTSARLILFDDIEKCRVMWKLRRAESWTKNSLNLSLFMPPCIVVWWIKPAVGDMAKQIVTFLPRWPTNLAICSISNSSPTTASGCPYIVTTFVYENAVVDDPTLFRNHEA